MVYINSFFKSANTYINKIIANSPSIIGCHFDSFKTIEAQNPYELYQNDPSEEESVPFDEGFNNNYSGNVEKMVFHLIDDMIGQLIEMLKNEIDGEIEQ